MAMMIVMVDLVGQTAAQRERTRPSWWCFKSFFFEKFFEKIWKRCRFKSRWSWRATTFLLPSSPGAPPSSSSLGPVWCCSRCQRFANATEEPLSTLLLFFFFFLLSFSSFFAGARGAATNLENLPIFLGGKNQKMKQGRWRRRQKEPSHLLPSAQPTTTMIGAAERHSTVQQRSPWWQRRWTHVHLKMGLVWWLWLVTTPVSNSKKMKAFF